MEELLMKLGALGVRVGEPVVVSEQLSETSPRIAVHKVALPAWLGEVEVGAWAVGVGPANEPFKATIGPRGSGGTVLDVIYRRIKGNIDKEKPVGMELSAKLALKLWENACMDGDGPNDFVTAAFFVADELRKQRKSENVLNEVRKHLKTAIQGRTGVASADLKDGSWWKVLMETVGR